MTNNGKALAIGSIILGIIGMIFSCLIIGGLPSIIGIVLGIIAVGKGQKSGFIGIVSSTVGIVISFFMISMALIEGGKISKIESYINKGQYEAALDEIEDSGLSVDTKRNFYYQIYFAEGKYDYAAEVLLKQLADINDLTTVSENLLYRMSELSGKVSLNQQERLDSYNMQIQEQMKQKELSEQKTAESEQKQDELKQNITKEELIEEDVKTVTPTQSIIPTPMAEEYIFSESNSRYLTEKEVRKLDEQELRLARNEIFARRGRIFSDPELVSYFSTKSWYRGIYTADTFDTGVFNKYEQANLKLIGQIEDELNGKNKTNTKENNKAKNFIGIEGHYQAGSDLESEVINVLLVDKEDGIVHMQYGTHEIPDMIRQIEAKIIDDHTAVWEGVVFTWTDVACLKVSKKGSDVTILTDNGQYLIADYYGVS